MYTIRFPATALRAFIECYWFLCETVEPPCGLEEVIFTDAKADIVFTFGSPYARIQGNRCDQTRLMHTSNVDAQRRYPVRILQHGQLNLVGVRFRPGGLGSFVGMPAHVLSGHTVGLHDVFGPEGVELEGKLFAATGRVEAQVSLLDQFFLSRLAVSPEYHRVMSWVKQIEGTGGQISVVELSRSAGLSVRSVDRLFQQVIGLPPKFFARTVRFRHVHHRLVNEPQARWDEIVAAHGYFDQSHFIKDIISLTGVDPKRYRAFLAKRRDNPAPNHIRTAPNHVYFLQDNGKLTRL